MESHHCEKPEKQQTELNPTTSDKELTTTII